LFGAPNNGPRAHCDRQIDASVCGFPFRSEKVDGREVAEARFFPNRSDGYQVPFLWENIILLRLYDYGFCSNASVQILKSLA